MVFGENNSNKSPNNGPVCNGVVPVFSLEKGLPRRDKGMAR